MTDNTAAHRLVTKLRSLDLAEDEAALLTEVFRLAHGAGGPEVEGFASLPDPFARGLFGNLGDKPVIGADFKKEFKGTDEELQAIVDWLGSLEAQD